MANRLAGKVAVVSGGASGIGGAVSRLFVGEGARVVIADIQGPRRDPALEKLVAESPDLIRLQKTDVSQEDQVKAAIDLAVNTWGRLDSAVACAGVPGQGSDIDLTVDEWDRIFAINAKGVFLLTKHSLPHMIKAGGGSITNISSVYGMIGVPGFAAYCASKAAVRNFTKSTAIEHAKQRIRANSIHPGLIDTPMMEDLYERSGDPEATRAAFAAQQPGGFNGTPEDIAWGCVYLATDEARFVNGAELAIDGGIVAR